MHILYRLRQQSLAHEARGAKLVVPLKDSIRRYELVEL